MHRRGRHARLRVRAATSGPQPVGLRRASASSATSSRWQPDRPDRDLPDRDLRAAVAPYAYDEIDLEEHSPQPPRRPASTRPLLRHRPARARLLQPRHLRHPHVRLGRAPRRGALDRSSGRRSARSPATSAAWTDNLLMRITDLFLTLPTLAVLLTRGRVTSGRATRMRVAIILALLFWTAAGADRARHLPLPAREGVRRGGQGARLRRPPDHHPAHAPEHPRPDHRQRDADRSRPRSSSRRRCRSSASASSRRRRRSAS